MKRDKSKRKDDRLLSRSISPAMIAAFVDGHLPARVYCDDICLVAGIDVPVNLSSIFQNACMDAHSLIDFSPFCGTI